MAKRSSPGLALKVGCGSPYGVSAVLDPQLERDPTEHDTAIARTLGRRVAEVPKDTVAKRHNYPVARASILFLLWRLFLVCRDVFSQGLQ